MIIRKYYPKTFVERKTRFNKFHLNYYYYDIVVRRQLLTRIKISVESKTLHKKCVSKDIETLTLKHVEIKHAVSVMSIRSTGIRLVPPSTRDIRGHRDVNGNELSRSSGLFERMYLSVSSKTNWRPITTPYLSRLFFRSAERRANLFTGRTRLI